MIHVLRHNNGHWFEIKTYLSNDLETKQKACAEFQRISRDDKAVIMVHFGDSSIAEVYINGDRFFRAYSIIETVTSAPDRSACESFLVGIPRKVIEEYVKEGTTLSAIIHDIVLAYESDKTHVKPALDFFDDSIIVLAGGEDNFNPPLQDLEDYASDERVRLGEDDQNFGEDFDDYN